MRIDTLSPAEGATRPAKRLGRGIGSGLGKTSGKGHKGQWARRVPKRGFNHNGKKEYVIVNLSALSELPEGTVVDYGFVMENGLAKEVKNNCGLKVLGNGELKVALTVKAAKFSASAKEAIEAAKGTAETL